MKISLIKNRELKIGLLLFIFVFLCVTITNIIMINNASNNLTREFYKRDVIIMDNIIKSCPKQKSTIVDAFNNSYINNNDLNGNSNKKKYATALKDLGEFGYSDYINLKTYPQLNFSFLIIKILSSFFIILGFIIIFIIAFKIFSFIYSHISEVSFSAEKIMNGCFDVRISDKNEGELSILGFQFNQMASRLKLSIELLEAEKENLKRFISDISHQLKTPLTSIRMFNELLLENIADSNQENEKNIDINYDFLNKSKIQIDRMEWLIQTSLKISRLETGIINFNKQNTDFCMTVKEAVSSLQVRWESKFQSVDISNNTTSILFPHDKEWCIEAIKNIVKNAIDYTPEGGNIHISVYDTDKFVKLSVRDSGKGILLDDLPHIFERFYQGRNTKGINKESTGIGLSLSKLIIEKHGGFINVKSKPDIGTDFILTLPKHLTKP